MLRQIQGYASFWLKRTSTFRSSKPLSTSTRSQYQEKVLMPCLGGSPRHLVGHYEEQIDGFNGLPVWSRRDLYVFNIPFGHCTYLCHSNSLTAKPTHTGIIPCQRTLIWNILKTYNLSNSVHWRKYTSIKHFYQTSEHIRVYMLWAEYLPL